jgi:thiol:disulfide interchange protein DsbD
MIRFRPGLLPVRCRPLVALATLMLVAPAAAQDADLSPHSEASLVADVSAVQPGTSVDVALRLVLEPEWHAYWINPGDAGLPVEVEWTLPEGVTAGPLRFPAPERIDLEGVTSYAHEGDVWFPTRIAVPVGFAGTEVQLRGRATWLVCADVCLPAEAEVALTLPVGAPAPTRWADGMRDALAALPVPAEGWQVAATATDGGYALTLQPPGEASLDGAQFFVFAKNLLSYTAAQDFRREGAAWAVELEASAYAEGTADRLRGVLVAAEGEMFPGGARAVEIDAEVAGGGLAAAAAVGDDQEAGLGLWLALLFALGGGVILNLMPCVFPILSIKILGFVEGRDADRAALRAHGLAFAGGVLVSFWALAGALLALRAGGEGLGWGFQLQSPWIVGGLALLMVGIGLNLLGVFEVGQRLSTAGAQLDRRSGLRGAFLSGVLATVVATPCTAPFMGAALGYALAQPPAVSMLVFTALGLGMALPYVLLSFFPAWISRLPRPGAWMETLKQALAFPLFATAIWLVWVFGKQTGVDGATMLLMASLLVGMAAWLVGRWPAARATPRARWVARGLALAALVAAGTLFAGSATRTADAAAAPEGWQAFEPAAIEALVAEGTPVFIDFTAAWCLTCQVNKKTTLQTPEVEAAFASAGVTRVRADWTNRDADITAFLDRFGRSGVPLYVYYAGDGAEPVLLPEVLTPQIVLDALAGTRSAQAE